VTADTGKIVIPLKQDYRFIHRPLDVGDWPPPGDTKRLGRLCHYITREEAIRNQFSAFLRSEGGCLVLCGYPGSGKTSFVRKMLAELGEECQVVDIWLNMARGVDSRVVKFRIIRRLYAAFVEDKRRRLPKAVVERMKFLYTQTLVSKHKSTSSRSQKKTGELDSSEASRPFVIPSPVSLPKLSAKLETETIKTLELARREYDDAMADEDIQALLQEIYECQSGPLPQRIGQRILRRLAQWARRIRRFWVGQKDVRVIFVLDELDKIREHSHVEEVLESLKNVFSCPGVSVIAITGAEIHHQAQDQALKNVSSVFGDVVTNIHYLPRMWACVDEPSEEVSKTWEFLEILMDESVGEDARRWCREQLQWYLEYVSRGLPRKVIAELEKFVVGDTRRPFLRFNAGQREIIESYATLQKSLHNELFALDHNTGRALARDTGWLEIYRVLDRVFGKPCDGEERFGIDLREKRFLHRNAWSSVLRDRNNYNLQVRSLQNIQALFETLVELGYVEREGETHKLGKASK
jgi:Cdc6-like AAA superfamily ATPase